MFAWVVGLYLSLGRWLLFPWLRVMPNGMMIVLLIDLIILVGDLIVLVVVLFVLVLRHLPR